MLGTVDVDVNYEGQIATLPLVVVEGHGASLCGHTFVSVGPRLGGLEPLP